MTSIEARTAVAEGAAQLGIAGTLEVLIAHAEGLLEEASSKKDALARARAASDHRSLVNLKEKVHN